MSPTLRQSAGNAVASGQSRTCKVALSAPTIQGNLVFVTAVSTSGTAPLTGPDGFTLILERSRGDLKAAAWYRENCPPLSSVQVTTGADRSLQVRMLEYAGAAQSGALDKVTVLTGANDQPTTGSSGTTAQDDSIVVAVVANRNASTTQFGFTGGLARLIESLTPSFWGFLQADSDDRRSRLTVHQTITSAAASFALTGLLSSLRDWVSFLVTFRGASSGPIHFSSTQAPSALTVTGRGDFTLFGPLTGRGTALTTSIVRARIGPFDYQYRLGGWTGLLIGNGTPFRVMSIDGLEGWQVRTSDDDLPRGDGALRGIDLQSARQTLIKVGTDGTQAEVEAYIDQLYRALVPQRDEDQELIWRHPGRPLRMLRYRPIDLIRVIDGWTHTVAAEQPITLRSADPRHYSAIAHQVEIPVTPAGSPAPVVTTVVNAGDGPAYPVIRVMGPSSSDPVTRILLQNVTSDVDFDVRSLLASGSALTGDMDARATGAPRSVVSIDGQPKYGSWQSPRAEFRLLPGENDLQLSTIPAGAPITASIEYRDTWYG